MKTGGMGGRWVTLDRPRPPRVADVEDFWGSAPPVASARCVYWTRQFAKGWRANRRIRGQSYYSNAQWYGVWLWEYLNVIRPLEAMAAREVPPTEERHVELHTDVLDEYVRELCRASGANELWFSRLDAWRLPPL